jgi:NNP family nitrate/nitrite transporter-like MFS transporter
MNSTGTRPLSSPYRWVILGIMWLTICSALVAQFQVAAFAYQIIPGFNLTPSQYSLVLTAPMLAGLFFSVAAGALADRWGVKKIVAVGFAFSVAGALFRFAAGNFTELFALMFLAGVCPGVLNANAAKLLGAWFPGKQMGTAMGIYFSATGVGMSLALATPGLFPSVESAFVTAGLMMLAVWVLWVVFVQAKPAGAPDQPVEPVTRYIGVAARSKNVWLVGSALMLAMGSSMVFSGFLPNALHSSRGMDPVTAGFMTSLVTFGTIAGSLLGPAIPNRLGKMKPFLATMTALGAMAGYWAWFTPQDAVMPVLLVVMGIMTGMCMPLLMAFPMLLPEIGPVYAGSAGGIIGTLQVTGAVCIPSFIIAPLAGQNYNVCFTLASMCLLLVSAVVLLLPELGAKARPGLVQVDKKMV